MNEEEVDYDEDDGHDEFHPWMFAGCDACAERANWLEAEEQHRRRLAVLTSTIDPATVR